MLVQLTCRGRPLHWSLYWWPLMQLGSTMVSPPLVPPPWHWVPPPWPIPPAVEALWADVAPLAPAVRLLLISSVPPLGHCARSAILAQLVVPPLLDVGAVPLCAPLSPLGVQEGGARCGPGCFQGGLEHVRTQFLRWLLNSSCRPLLRPPTLLLLPADAAPWFGLLQLPSFHGLQDGPFFHGLQDGAFFHGLQDGALCHGC